MTEEKAKAILEAVENHDSWEILQLCKGDEKSIYFIINQLIKKQSMIEQAIKHLTE